MGSKGDVRGALAVEVEINRIKDLALEVVGIEKFAGNWRIRYTNSSVRRYTINGEGYVTFNEVNGKATPILKGRIALRGQKYFIEFEDGTYEILTLSGRSLKTALFSTKEAMLASTPSFLGESIDDLRSK